MRKFVFLGVLLLALAALAVIYFRAAGDGPAALAAAIKAHGGEAGIQRTRTGTLTAKGHMADELGLKFPATVEENFQAPGQFRRIVAAEGFDGQIDTVGFSAHEGKRWRRGPDGKLETAPAGSTDEQSMLSFLPELLDIHKRKLTLTPLPDEEVGGRPARGFRAFLTDDDQVSLYFDDETKLCVKLKKELGQAAPKKVTLETIFADYQDVDGVQLPMKVTQLVNGKMRREMKIESVRLLDHLPASALRGP